MKIEYNDYSSPRFVTFAAKLGLGAWVVGEYPCESDIELRGNEDIWSEAEREAVQEKEQQRQRL